jgi:hypothetical protein
MAPYRIGYISLLLGIYTSLYASPPSGITFFSPRSQITNAAQELIQDQQYIYHNSYVHEHMFDLAFSIAHSLDPDRLATIIFGDSQLTISGSALPDRNINDLLADHFGLSPNFKSTIEIIPEVKSFILPATLYYNLDALLYGLYIRLQIPFVWTKTTIDIIEEIIEPGSNVPFPALYMDIPAISSPYNSFVQALTAPTTFGAMHEPRIFGNIAGCRGAHKAAIANITTDLGWNYYFNEKHTSHFGIKFRVVTPNGNKPHARLLYEPIAGNGHHWEVGVGIHGHVLLWNPDDQQQLDLYMTLLVTHLLSSRQHRSFDLKDFAPICKQESRFFSRYMLVKEFDENRQPVGRLAPLINYTTVWCDINTPAEFDGGIMFSYTRKQFTLDIGYNGWIRTKEDVDPVQGLPLNRLGLKGIQNTFLLDETPSPATEHRATIFGDYIGNQALLTDNPSPQFVNTQDLDIESAESPLVVTHKIFVYLSYTCDELHKQYQLQPFIGLGGEFEFEGINDINEFEPPTDKNTMSQWSFWFRAGLLFD